MIQKIYDTTVTVDEDNHIVVSQIISHPSHDHDKNVNEGREATN